MNEVWKIEIPVEEATVAALSNARQRNAVGHLIDRLVRPGVSDPSIVLFEQTVAAAVGDGMTEADINAELAAYNAERRA